MELGTFIRKDFSIFSRFEKDGLVYLDSAATSLKPRQVLDAMRGYFENFGVNVHRGSYALAEQAAFEYERAREKIANFISAARPEEIVFTKNATEALNLLARSFAAEFLREGEGILLSEMEHHANLVPWQQIAREKKIKLFFLEFDPASGELVWNKEKFFEFLKERKIKLVSLTHVSNVLGTINPIAEIAGKAHEAGALVAVDASQSVPHFPVSVSELGADFLVFSGHKMLGPDGIGVLWAKHGLLEKMPPFLTGGEMVLDVRLEESRFQDPPLRFEAGTPPVSQAIGLGAAVDFLQKIGMEKIREHEQTLMRAAIEALALFPEVKILGSKEIAKRSGVIAFVIEGIHPHDVGSFLDEEGVMIRAGDHCAKPLHKKLKLVASSRASFHIYNDLEDIENFGAAIEKLKKVFLK